MRSHNYKVNITLNETESNRLGINKALLTACLAVHYGPGVPITSLWEGDYPVGVVLKADHKDNNQFTSLGNEYIPVMGGTTSVPLRQFATITPTLQTVV